MISLQTIEKDVIELSLEVGEFIHQEWLQFDQSKIEKKESFNNLVSYVDKESEQRIVAGLQKIVPGASFLGEEGTSITGTNEYQWIIDPLDGTTNFTHGLPIFAISIGLARKEKGVLGVVYEINRKECYHAFENAPAYCNEKIIKVSPHHISLKESLLATGFPYYKFEKQVAYLEIIKIFLDKTHGIRRLGSAAVDLAYVACGRLEGFFEYNLNSWDVAAGIVIVQQAGGRVSDFNGGDNFLFGGQLCASSEGIHREMLSVIQEHWRD